MIVLSIGVTNMSKQNAIIRKLTAVETLGCAQIICSDKTGTLTTGRFEVKKIFCNGFREEELKKMNEYAVDGAFVGEEVKCRIRELMRK